MSPLDLQVLTGGLFGTVSVCACNIHGQPPSPPPPPPPPAPQAEQGWGGGGGGGGGGQQRTVQTGTYKEVTERETHVSLAWIPATTR